ncbi:MAG TPA: GNAT family N-acetyltransferase [Desulfotomaculum sp.]|nr:GNAT family N-acetyltransferase [Desulfotomaculum sp.]
MSGKILIDGRNCFEPGIMAGKQPPCRQMGDRLTSDNFCLLTLAESKQWTDLLHKVKTCDIHYEPGYYRVFEGNDQARLFVYQQDSQFVIYPFLLRKVDYSGETTAGENYFDITSPYGYGGPLASPGADGNTLKGFWQSFIQFCQDSNIITEFIRFHPLIHNHEQAAGYVEAERNSSVVFIDLSIPEEQIWSGYDYSNRKNIKKAARSGVTIVIDQTPRFFTDFSMIYRHTMDRNNSRDFYYFPDTFFDKIHRFLNGNYLYAHAFLEGKLISTELLLYSGTFIHSFLGGTLAEYFSFRPNNLLKHEAILWAKRRGIGYFILGGGQSDDDGIFRYKQTFAKNSLADYCIGKKIHDQDAVRRLTGLTDEGQEHKAFFPPYRRC